MRKGRATPGSPGIRASWPRSHPGQFAIPTGPYPARLPKRRWFLGLLLLGLGFWEAHSSQINPPLGPYMNPKPDDFATTTNFALDDRVVLTPYFYWYDVYTQAHIVDGDGTDALTDHPPTLDGFSYRSKSWHKGELLDMIDAGIDVLLPVYWGDPSQRIPGVPISAQPWSFSGIPPLVLAREELLAEGKQPPAIGLFYDTSTLQYNATGQQIDLATDYGRRWFYETVRDFFSLVPARHWAMIDGKPVVFLYAAGFAANHDQTCIDSLRTAFAQDFGGRSPFIVREISWQVQTENVYAWGGALGLRNPGVASLGPGYDHSAVPGRQPLVIGREDGDFFARQWAKFLRAPSRLVMIETWNEYHEGTDVAASREYGRQYVELNRHYADWFKQGVYPPLPRGPYTDVRLVSATLQSTNLESGLDQFDHADGVTAPDEIGGSACRKTVATVHAGRYVYFRIDDSFKWTDPMRVNIEVDYFDSASGSFRIEFDGSDTNAPFNGAYTATTLNVSLLGGNTWKTARFSLAGAHFLNSQNGGADFRLNLNANPFYLRQVRVIRPGIPTEIGQPVHAFQQDFAEPLGTNWTRVGQVPGLFEVSNGSLQIHSASGPPQHFLVALPATAGPAQEVLARVRVVQQHGSNELSGGLTVAFDLGLTNGLGARLQSPGPNPSGIALHRSLGSDGVRTNAPWTTNRWYWLRLRHQTNWVTHAPDLFARIWLADGETAEPDAWRVWWDYCPASHALLGLAGFQAGNVTGWSLMESDYFLLKTDALPSITPHLPPLKPRRAALQALEFSGTRGFVMALNGEPNTGYFVGHSGDLMTWTEAAVATDSSGCVEYRDLQATNAPHQFYRAWPSTP